MKRFRIGERYRVTECSGLDSGREGTIIEKQRMPMNGQGVPLVLGYYKPISKDEVAIIDDNGHMFLMYKKRLQKVHN